MVKQMFQEASIAGKFSNHSLRAIGATTSLMPMYQKPSFRIGQDIHQKALRMYEQMTPQQDLAISKILQSEQKLPFKAAKQLKGIDVNKKDTDYDLSFSQADLDIFEDVHY